LLAPVVEPESSSASSALFYPGGFAPSIAAGDCGVDGGARWFAHQARTLPAKVTGSRQLDRASDYNA